MPAFGTILTGDALAMLRTLPDQSVHCCVTSPPYWGLRDYGVLGQMMPIFLEVHRVLRADGTLWLNLGDSYIGYHGNKYTRNRRSVWSVATHPFPDAHFATFPPDLIRPCALAGCPAGGVVLDPFFGAGTRRGLCREEERRYLGIEISPDYVAMAERRIGQAHPKRPQPLSLLDMGVA